MKTTQMKSITTSIMKDNVFYFTRDSGGYAQCVAISINRKDKSMIILFLGNGSKVLDINNLIDSNMTTDNLEQVVETLGLNYHYHMLTDLTKENLEKIEKEYNEFTQENKPLYDIDFLEFKNLFLFDNDLSIYEFNDLLNNFFINVFGYSKKDSVLFNILVNPYENISKGNIKFF